MTLHFGTAGVRAPLGPGPEQMNVRTVTLVATAVARHLREHEPAGALVVVGGDARHGSRDFVEVVCAVLEAHDLVVVTPGLPVPTPVVAAAVRARDAVAGVMVTASHNSAGDNGIKVYGRGGAQIVPPTDAAIEAHLVVAAREGVAVPAAARGARVDGPQVDDDAARGARVDSPHVDDDAASGVRVDSSLVDDYVAAVVAGLPSPADPPRVALTPVHGVGGEVCRRVLAGIGVHDVTLVPEEADPDPDFPTVDSPNPERPQTTARLLAVAEGAGADVAIALDPDADRCAVGFAGSDGRWRMLDGDDTGAVLADHLLTAPLPSSSPGGGDAPTPVVASTIVSSRLPSLLVPAREGRHVETLTGFKWLVRAGEPLRYAYEEAIGHCVLPDVVADKDGIAAAAAWCAMVGSGGPGVAARLDALTCEFGAHMRRNVPLPLGPGDDPTDALRRAETALGGARLPGEAGETGVLVATGVLGEAGETGVAVAADVLGEAGVTGRLTPLAGTAGLRLEVPGARAVIRPSGTEPLLKTYIEAWTPAAPTAADRAEAGRRLDALAKAVAAAIALT